MINGHTKGGVRLLSNSLHFDHEPWLQMHDISLLNEIRKGINFKDVEGLTEPKKAWKTRGVGSGLVKLIG